ncbi:hypothetical protein [Sporolactobacillus laevolacticus]|uniref:hypothetical protein n=1 Tax=Sporolactobacillus laevolacticus TaxID=33018 RepID=UPI0025B2823C|nr:hypothetical protein [Sporolactobacillus laevolacticus]MDN3956015.1 hypothetical protein [Sporolactobacillus laevolacticus]
MEKEEILKINKDGWDKVSEQFFSATALPTYGPFAPKEEELQLFGNVSHKKIVEEYRSDASIIEDNPNNWYCSQRAKLIPATIIFKCRKR